MPSTHTFGCISKTLRGYHSVRRLARSPRTSSADGQKVDTHVFFCVDNESRIKRQNLGVIGKINRDEKNRVKKGRV